MIEILQKQGINNISDLNPSGRLDLMALVPFSVLFFFPGPGTRDVTTSSSLGFANIGLSSALELSNIHDEHDER